MSRLVSSVPGLCLTLRQLSREEKLQQHCRQRHQEEHHHIVHRASAMCCHHRKQEMQVTMLTLYVLSGCTGHHLSIFACQVDSLVACSIDFVAMKSLFIVSAWGFGKHHMDKLPAFVIELLTFIMSRQVRSDTCRQCCRYTQIFEDVHACSTRTHARNRILMDVHGGAGVDAGSVSK